MFGCDATSTGDVSRSVGESRADPVPRWSLLPVAVSRGERKGLRLSLLDGRRVRFAYPAQLGLEKLGVVPYRSARLSAIDAVPGRGAAIGRDFRIAYGQLDAYLRWSNGGRAPALLARYRGAGGTVGLWDLPSAETDQLAFQFGRWVVLVYDYSSAFDGGAATMTDAERAAWVRQFRGRESRDGMLRLRTSGRLRLTRTGEHAGPQLQFGSIGARGLTIALGACRSSGPAAGENGRRVGRGRGTASWCVSHNLRATASGPRAFRRALIDGLDARMMRRRP
jgi:hypothetical protein